MSNPFRTDLQWCAYRLCQLLSDMEFSKKEFDKEWLWCAACDKLEYRGIFSKEFVLPVLH